MKTYVDKVTIWHQGEAMATVEAVDGCAEVHLLNHFYSTETWLKLSAEVLKAVQDMESEQTELDADSKNVD